MDRIKAEMLIQNIASFNGVDPDLAIAFTYAESGFDEFSVRHEPNWRWFLDVEGYAARCRISQDTERVLQACSLGLMQVMGTVARELGHKDNLLMLTKPELGIKFGCFKILEIKKRYGKIEEVISAYNMGTPKLMADGKTYVNQQYIEKVLGVYRGRKQ